MPPPQLPSYAASPLGNFPELGQMYASNFAAPLSDAQTSVQYARDQITNANAKQAKKDAEDRAAAFADAKNYQVVQRPDGGYGFYGPDGKEVSASQYAQVAGKLPSDVLKDSQNPIDHQFIQDSKNLSDYYLARTQGFNPDGSVRDPKQAKIANTIESQVKKLYGLDLHSMNHQDVLTAYRSNYPTIFGANQNNAPGRSGTSLLFPSAQNLYEQAGGESAFSAGLGSSGGIGG